MKARLWIRPMVLGLLVFGCKPPSDAESGGGGGSELASVGAPLEVPSEIAAKFSAGGALARLTATITKADGTSVGAKKMDTKAKFAASRANPGSSATTLLFQGYTDPSGNQVPLSKTDILNNIELRIFQSGAADKVVYVGSYGPSFPLANSQTLQITLECNASDQMGTKLGQRRILGQLPRRLPSATGGMTFKGCQASPSTESSGGALFCHGLARQ